LREKGACSIYELARRLGRDYKNVHTDVTQLAALGLIERQEDGRVAVAWDVVRAELRF
jgi:predicted transcriptional regulator